MPTNSERLSSRACVLLEKTCLVTLSGTELARAHCSTLLLKLLKIGAVILQNTRQVRFLLSTAHPDRNLFDHRSCTSPLDNTSESPEIVVWRGGFALGSDSNQTYALINSCFS